MHKNNSDLLLAEYLQILKASFKNKKKNSSLLLNVCGLKLSNQQAWSIRMGNVLEDTVNYVIKNFSKSETLLDQLATNGKNSKKRFVGKNKKGKGKHQIDSLFRSGNTIFCMEQKTNTDLDSGKKRDTSETRETEIQSLLEKQFVGQKVEVVCFNPLFENDKEISGLGLVRGWNWLKEKANHDITFEDFKKVLQHDEAKKLYDNFINPK